MALAHMTAAAIALENLAEIRRRGSGRPTRRVGYRGSATILRDNERRTIDDALAQSRGNQSEAAKLLGIGRDALRYKMAKYKLLRTKAR